jgi:hypothetical protein
MRPKLYCHSVRSEDDGRISAYISGASDEDLAVEITITAPFEAFDEGEVLRAWHEYKVNFKPLNVP